MAKRFTVTPFPIEFCTGRNDRKKTPNSMIQRPFSLFSTPDTARLVIPIG